MPESDSDWQSVPLPWSVMGRAMTAFAYTAAASRDLMLGYTAHSADFLESFLGSTAIFAGVEAARMPSRPPFRNAEAYAKIFETNADLARRGTLASLKSAKDMAAPEIESAIAAWTRTLMGGEGELIDEWAERQARVARALVHDYPAAIDAVSEEYGFHFERGHSPLVAETDRFLLYRIMPTDPDVAIDEGAKPLVIIPPYVLGSNILAFLPGEERSYVHAYANQGVPTYMRIQKDIATTEAVQIMTPEDDCRDTRHLCEVVYKAHGRPVTLNGYCQGGYTALCNILSGELDGLVDALITCVSPMDGTYSVGLAGFLDSLPPEFNDLAYGTKVLPSGNSVADGHLMGWVYKLKSIEAENPASSYLRNLSMFARKGGVGPVSKSAAAITYWLSNERRDLPLAITEMSFASYNRPISADGTLPVTLFDRKLELPRLGAHGVRWLICYGEHDDLVEKETALAPTKHVQAEVTEFPRGHVAIATSWSNPRSACALHTVFGKGYRGPVRYQLDLDARKRRAEMGGTVELLAARAELSQQGSAPKEAAPAKVKSKKAVKKKATRKKAAAGKASRSGPPATRRSKASKPSK